MTERQLRDMKLHQIERLSEDITVIRVVGGLIYIIQTDQNTTSVFVPFDRGSLDPNLYEPLTT